MDRLSTQLQYVGRNVPFFREQGCDDGRPLEGFPCTYKAEIRGNYGAFLSDEFAARRPELVRALSEGPGCLNVLPGAVPTYGRYHGDVLVEETSGTSGTRFRIARLPAERLRVGFGMWRRRREVDPDVWPSTLFPMIHWGPDSAAIGDPWNLELPNLQGIYARVAESGARWIHCDPRILLQHIEVFEAAGWRPSLPDLRVIETANQFVDAATSARLRDFYGVQHVDLYGMLETLGIALTCVHGAHHVIDENVHVEILDEGDRPVPVGTTGRIVVTSLRQRLFPFVRYVTDDFGALSAASCGCRQSGAPAARILTLTQGRASNVVKGLSGRVFGDRLFEHIFRNLAAFDLSCVHVRQITLDDFIVETNPIEAPSAFLGALQHQTERKFRRAVTLRHVVLSEAEMARRRRQKPWLFRCEC